MRQLTEIPNNLHTVALLDLLIAQRENNNGKLGIFIIMNYIPSDLKNILSSANGNTDFTEDHAVKIIYDILCALKFLHSANILHRDLKPANILIDEDCNIRLCDFGLSRSLPKSLVGKGSGNSKRMRDSILKCKLQSKDVDDELRKVIAEKLIKQKDTRL